MEVIKIDNDRNLNQVFENNNGDKKEKSSKKVTKYRSKHFSQMTVEERNYLLDKRDKMAQVKLEFSDHASEVRVKRNLREKDIYKSLVRGQIVDYRVIYDKYDNICDHRITVRSTYLKGKDVLYIAVSLDNPVIITIYPQFADNMLTKYNKDNEKFDGNIKIIDNGRFKMY